MPGSESREISRYTLTSPVRNAETGKYELDGVTVNGTIKVEFEKESNGGCGGKNAALAIGIALAFAVFALKRG